MTSGVSQFKFANRTRLFCQTKALFTWREVNPPRRVTIGSPSLLGRDTLSRRVNFLPCKRSRWGYPPERIKFSTIGLLSHSGHL